MIGKMLGHYEIKSQLGKGGMGEVFQAKDQILGRDVAVKVLPEEFARDTDRVARFQREAKVLASLNHPNIAAIYGLEQSEGTNFLVLELIEGETLADRIKAGPIPVEESLRLALQIAEALEAAHEKGVIHRDLKPANIKLTPDRKVKVLDFGLAKAFAGEQGEVNLSNSPTLSDAATKQGVILGTAAYMSPEQARGDVVDRRADIWAFGVVLFEMLTGSGMFEGRTVSDTLAAVLMREPEWRRLPANLHSRIRVLLERCLEKEPKDRYAGIGDARVDVQKALGDPNGVLQPIEAAEPRRRLRSFMPLIAAAVVLSFIAGGVAVWKLKPSESGRITRLYHELPKDQQFNSLSAGALAVSPDGRSFVYCSKDGIYLRSVDEFDARLIPGTKGAQRPFFSPDGKWVGYQSTPDSQLKKIATTGGAPIKLTDSSPTGSFSWGADDFIVYGQSGKGIMRVSSNGGTPEVIVKSQNNELFISPQILPDGKSVLSTNIADQPYKIILLSLAAGERKELFPGDTARYLPTGHVVFAVDNGLFVMPFDIRKNEAAGGPVSVVEGVLRAGGGPQYAVSDSGTLLYIPGTSATGIPLSLIWVDRNGVEEAIGAPSNVYSDPRISPDGKRAALTVGSLSGRDIWIWDFVRKTLMPLTFAEGENAYAVWSPDSKRIAFHTHQNNARGSVYWKLADGTGREEAIGTFPGKEIFPWTWSADGKILLVRAGYSGLGILDIGVLFMVGDHKYKTLLGEKYAEFQPQISPDGRWMAYTSNESGQDQVYVRPFPELDKGGRWQVSTNGGDSPLWSPDGRELFYRNGDIVMAVPVRTAPALSLDTGRILFKGSYYASNTNNAWDISPDGKRFLMMKEAVSATSVGEGPRKINIVLNWFEELKQRVPVK